MWSSLSASAALLAGNGRGAKRTMVSSVLFTRLFTTMVLFTRLFTTMVLFTM